MVDKTDTKAPSMRELLEMPSTEFETEPALPQGHYKGTIVKHEFGRSKRKKTGFVRFFIQASEPTEDVEDEQGVLENIDLSKITLSKDFFITAGALKARSKRMSLRKALDATLGPDGRSFDERIPETTGVEVIFHVTKEQPEDSEDEDDAYNRVGYFMKA
jgi:hypothetical protein